MEGRKKAREGGKSEGGKGERMVKRKENSFAGKIMVYYFWVCTFQLAQWLKKRLFGQGKVSESKSSLTIDKKDLGRLGIPHQ